MKRWITAAIAGLAALAPVASLAAIDNTHHDMVQYLGVTEKCAYCHSKTLTATTVGATYGPTGNFCILVCHVGTGATAGALPASPGYFTDTFASVGAISDPSIVAFSGGSNPSHGNVKASIPAPDAAADVTATNWPHTAAATMECTSCHAVHDGTHPPFLNAPYSASTGNAASFCQKCHTGSAASGTAGRFNDITGVGAHPTEFQWDSAVALARTGAKSGATSTFQAGRTIAIKSALLTTSPVDGVGAEAGVTTVAAFNANGIHWATGGHFMTHTAATPVTSLPGASEANNYFGCYSCHSAHQTGGSVIGGQVATSLAMAPHYPTVAPFAGLTSSVLCAGCHGASAANSALIENPGTTTRFHPVNKGTVTTGVAAMVHNHADHGAVANNPNVPSTGTFPIPMSAAYTNAYVLKGAGGQIICSSCHDVHGGVTGLMAIRQIGSYLTTPVATTATNSVCVGCHDQGANGSTGVNYHHPGRAVNYATGNGLFMPSNATAGSAAWTTVDGLGKLSDGLSCPDCHVFQGTAARRGTAHNWN